MCVHIDYFTYSGQIRWKQLFQQTEKEVVIVADKRFEDVYTQGKWGGT